MFEQLLPTIHAKDKSAPEAKRKKPKKGKGYDLTAKPRGGKYDHAQMIADRLSGMTWTEVAAKHGVTYGNAYSLCMYSRAIHSLTPEQVARLGTSTR